MKKYFVLLAIIIVAAASGCVQNSNHNVHMNDNSAAKTTGYLENWTVSNYSEENGIVLQSPKKDASFVISVDNPEKNYTLQELVEITGTNKLSEVYNVIYSHEIKIKGREAYETLFTTKNLDAKMLEILVNGDKIYLFTYTAKIGAYDNYIDEIRSMINNWNFH